MGWLGRVWAMVGCRWLVGVREVSVAGVRAGSVGKEGTVRACVGSWGRGGAWGLGGAAASEGRWGALKDIVLLVVVVLRVCRPWSSSTMHAIAIKVGPCGV